MAAFFFALLAGLFVLAYALGSFWVGHKIQQWCWEHGYRAVMTPKAWSVLILLILLFAIFAGVMS